jgi:hypothetical protein
MGVAPLQESRQCGVPTNRRGSLSLGLGFVGGFGAW